MSVFDGLAGVLSSVLGAPVTISGSFAGTIQAIFREMPLDQLAGDGRVFVVVTPTLQVRRNVAVLIKGDIAAPSETPGRTFTVLQSYPSGSPAVDALVSYAMEEVRP